MDHEALFDQDFYGLKGPGLKALAAPRLITRRSILTGLAAGGAALAAGSAQAAGALMCPPVVGKFGGGSGGGSLYDDSGNFDFSGAVPDDGPGERRLRMTCTGLGETYDEVYVRDGQYVPEALEKFSRFARDKSDGSQRAMDPKAMDIIWKVWKMMDTSSVFNLNSGYRSPAHNASLRGAAKNSYHMRGQACDIAMPGASPAKVYAAAMAVQGGGVGRYNTFTHVDSGPRRTWSG